MRNTKPSLSTRLLLQYSTVIGDIHLLIAYIVEPSGWNMPAAVRDVAIFAFVFFPTLGP